MNISDCLYQAGILEIIFEPNTNPNFNYNSYHLKIIDLQVIQKKKIIVL